VAIVFDDSDDLSLTRQAAGAMAKRWSEPRYGAVHLAVYVSALRTLPEQLGTQEYSDIGRGGMDCFPTSDNHDFVAVGPEADPEEVRLAAFERMRMPSSRNVVHIPSFDGDAIDAFMNDPALWAGDVFLREPKGIRTYFEGKWEYTAPGDYLQIVDVPKGLIELEVTLRVNPYADPKAQRIRLGRF
jgi:hypothetical protein